MIRYVVCPICKTENPERVKYCLKCGRWLIDGIGSESKIVSYSSVRKNKKFFRVLVAIVNILSAFVMLLSLFQGLNPISLFALTLLIINTILILK